MFLAAVMLNMSQKVKITKTTRTRKKKTGGNSGYMSCNICHGTGRIKKPKRKKS